MVPFGKVMATLTVCEMMRLLEQAEKGLNWLAGIEVPFRLTASVSGSKEQAASSRRLTVPVVTVVPGTGVGAMKRSGPGAGIARREDGQARSRLRNATRRLFMGSPRLAGRPATKLYVPLEYRREDGRWSMTVRPGRRSE